MSDLLKTLERFEKDLKALQDIKKAKDEAKKLYDEKISELDKLGNAEIPESEKKAALENIADLKERQNQYNLKNNEYGDTIIKLQNDFEEAYSTVLHSLVDTVYDARRMMHYLTTVKDSGDSDYKNDNEAIKKYLQTYTQVQSFNEAVIDELTAEADGLTKFLSFGERKNLVNAFALHAKDDLKNLKTFIEKKGELEKILSEVDLTESVEKLPTAEEVVNKYKNLIPELFDSEKGEVFSMSVKLEKAYLDFFGKDKKVEKKVEFKYEFEMPFILPLYADPIVTVSFDFKLEFKFKATALAAASFEVPKVSASADLKGTKVSTSVAITGPTATVQVEAKASVSFGVTAALSLRIIQLIKASINVGIAFETTVGAKAELKSQMTSLSGTVKLEAKSELIAATWISLSVCGPVSAIIEAVTGKKLELRWTMGELKLFKLTMNKNAELSLNAIKEELKAESNFRPFSEGFTVEFIGKEEIKRKLKERYNNKLSIIKQQFLSNDEMKAAEKDKDELLRKFDVTDFNAGKNDDFKKKIDHHLTFMTKYENNFDNFMGKIVETIAPHPEKFQKYFDFVNSYSSNLKDHYHTLFVEKNNGVENYFKEKNIRGSKDDVWKRSIPLLKNVVLENEDPLIKKLKDSLLKAQHDEKHALLLTNLEIIDLDYIGKTDNIDFKRMYELVETLRKEAQEFVEQLVIGDIGKNDCVFGFASTEIMSSSRRNLRDKALEKLKSNIDSLIQDARNYVRNLEYENSIKAIKEKLTLDATDLKKQFDKKKIDDVKKEYRKYLEEKPDMVTIYFDRILDKIEDSQTLDSIKKGIDRLTSFHKENKERQDYLKVPSEDDIKKLYNGETEFEQLVRAELAKEHEAEVKILSELKVDIDLYEYFNKDKTQKKLTDLLENIKTLKNFRDTHREIALEEKGIFSDTTYKDYLKKSPQEMQKMLDKAIANQAKK